MIKPTPNPPETDPVSPYESLHSKKLHEAADRALDHYLCPPGSTPPPRKTRGMYAVTADNKNEELLMKHWLRPRPLLMTLRACCPWHSGGRCWGLRS